MSAASPATGGSPRFNAALVAAFFIAHGSPRECFSSRGKHFAKGRKNPSFPLDESAPLSYPPLHGLAE